MATLAFTGLVNSGLNLSTWTWTGLDEGDTNLAEANWALLEGNYSDIIIEMDDTGGSWGSGTLVWEGKGLGFTNWAPLVDLSGTALSFTADAAKFSATAPYYIRPRATAGSSVNVIGRLQARRVRL